ncbi:MULTISPECIES: hypothetical protein [Rodentibacter]|uniref:Uncharacterized protein n=1 Tax=Rodentibacter pneumotropicus TaxID=758 RepID=A0A4S2PW71_9PAST|nr:MULTISPECIES: hypothetical protein [Pasteurellaceae]TGY50804.1 hypothetical protein E5343_00160 [Pasteurella caecimuris]THA00969.1 hypothetical protein D3M74_06480 [Rodentibacter pneumotropicus]THA08171.1 hypothetical protein D3M78_08130 [Rodentibacter pneumotropicus]THA09138.1 hypothetical protein D3M77_02865 [Rodentibacter pneumotropicus]THA17264.1 hypothetical protein D3M76_01950 [Rodentibacter pneumotropicus]
MPIMPYLTGNEEECPAQIYCRLNNIQMEQIRSWGEARHVANKSKFRVEAHFDDASPKAKAFFLKLAGDKAYMGEDILLASDKINVHSQGLKLSDYKMDGQLKIAGMLELIRYIGKEIAPPLVTKREFLQIDKNRGE